MKKEMLDIHIRVLDSQNQGIEKIQGIAETDFNYKLSKNSLIRIAIHELFKNLESTEDVKKLLIKHNCI